MAEETKDIPVKNIPDLKKLLPSIMVLVAAAGLLWFSFQIQGQNGRLTQDNAQLVGENGVLNTQLAIARLNSSAPSEYVCTNFTIYPPRIPCPDAVENSTDVCYVVGNQAIKVNQSQNMSAWLYSNLELCRKQ